MSGTSKSKLDGMLVACGGLAGAGGAAPAQDCWLGRLGTPTEDTWRIFISGGFRDAASARPRCSPRGGDGGGYDVPRWPGLRGPWCCWGWCLPQGGTSSSDDGGCGCPGKPSPWPSPCGDGDDAARLRLGSDCPSEEKTGTWMLSVLGLGDLLCADRRRLRPLPPPPPPAAAWSAPMGGMPSSELSDDARSSLLSTLMPRECDTLLSDDASFISTDPLGKRKTRNKIRKRN